MKLLIISNLYPPHYVGGYELICETVVNALRDRGHAVHVLTSDYNAERSTDEGHHVRRLLKLHGILGRPWLPIYRLRQLEFHNNAILHSVLDQFGPDLVYCWNFSGLSKSLLFTLQSRDVRTVFSMCDHWIARSADSDVWLRWWNTDSAWGAHRLVRTLLQLSGLRRVCEKTAPTASVRNLRFPHIHFCSAFLREFTVKAGFPVSHGAVIHCPVNTERFVGQPKPASVPLKRLLFAGRLHPDKGVTTALRALARLCGKFHGSLTLCGAGEPAFVEGLERFVRDYCLPVTFLKANTQDMPGVYSEHDALLFTSEWGEPFALTPLEAMACGLPVIGTTTGGSIELFRHGQNALTYQAGDDEQLAQRILEMQCDPVGRFKLANIGQREVQSRFAEPLILRQVEDYLNASIAA